MALALLLAALLPLAPQPAAPFPKIITDAPVVTDVAPGVQYGEYQMLTQDGPLDVHVVAVNLSDPSVHVGTALAQNRLVSSGETVSSMAQRTGAVAGINGDYFDINQTNQPLNIFMQDGRLIRMPMKRWAIAFSKDGRVSFGEFQISETAALPGGTLPLNTMNDWPPPGGESVFITPEYGALKPEENVTEIALDPVSGTPPFATYRVRDIADNTAEQPAGYYLAIGQNEYGHVDPPNPGDAVTISGQSDPSIDDIASALGGGPLLVQNGAWYDDPDGPSKGEFATHMPATGAAVTRDGTLLLFEIDGRQPARSIGVLQPQIAALMIAFGAQTGMQFDGGGSSTIVARVPGDADAQVQNSPSDGVERRVADGLFVYSDAPEGPPARVYAMPQRVRALPGAHVSVRLAITDAAGHAKHVCACAIRMEVVPQSAGRMEGDTFVAGSQAQSAAIDVRAGALRTQIPVDVTNDVARGDILPLRPVLQAGESVALQARAFDSQGYPIALPELLHWSAQDGRIDDSGRFTAGASDASVSVRLGDRVVTQTITVGEHLFPLPFDREATFATAPRDGPGGLGKDASCDGCLSLAYDFNGTERAAYADANMTIPQIALGLRAEIFGDGNGEVLRAAVNNAINERFLYTLATIDWRGWREVELRFPPALPQPLTLRSIYVIDRVGPGPAVKAAGRISIRNVRAVLAGRGSEPPK